MVVAKYLNFATFSKDLLVISKLYATCPANPVFFDV